jgi:lipopolysaccharide export system permease protein
VVLSGGSFMIQDGILPTSNQEAQRLRDLIAGREPRHQDPRQPWTMSDDGRLFHYRTADPERSSLQGLSVYRLNPSTFAMEERFYAEQARYDGSQWQVARAWERNFQADGNNLKQLEQASVDLGAGPALFQSEDSFVLWGIQRDSDQMSYSDQSAYIIDLERRGYDTLNLRVDLARKVTTPIIPVCMVLLGFPFAFRVGSHGSLFGIGLAIALTVIYWSVLAIFNALGTAAVLPPLLAAWAPNIFFASLGLYFSLHLRT